MSTTRPMTASSAAGSLDSAEELRAPGFDQAIDKIEAATTRIESMVERVANLTSRITGEYSAQAMITNGENNTPPVPEGYLPRLHNQANLLHHIIDITECKVDELCSHLD